MRDSLPALPKFDRSIDLQVVVVLSDYLCNPERLVTTLRNSQQSSITNNNPQHLCKGFAVSKATDGVHECRADAAIPTPAIAQTSLNHVSSGNMPEPNKHMLFNPSEYC